MSHHFSIFLKGNVMPTNNLYRLGKPEKRQWQKPLMKVRAALASLFLGNQNCKLKSGVIELPVKYRDFKPDLSVKYSKPVDFSALADADDKDVREAIDWLTNNIGWFHSIDLRGSISTPGARGWEDRCRKFRFADLLPGKTVLDIGAMEGGDTFAAEDAGAKQLTAYDVDNYFSYDLGLNAAWDDVVERYLDAKKAGEEKEWEFLNCKKFGFELCKEVRKSTATRKTGSVYDLSPSVHGTFDVVFCFGLLYHVRHPILVLDRLYEMCNEMVFLNTQIHQGYTTNSETILYYNDTWRGSYSNWFIPTPTAFVEMVSSSGFRSIEIIETGATSISLIAYK